METEDEEKAERKREELLRKKEAARSSVILDSRLRKDRSEVDSTKAQKRTEHQKHLFDTIQRDGVDRFGENDAVAQQQKKAVFRKFEAYKPGSTIPPEAREGKIFLDRRAETFILPLYGRAVPFHIITIKNIAKAIEGEYTTLRFNFNVPGQPGTKKDDVLPFDDPHAHFVHPFSVVSMKDQLSVSKR